MAGDRPTVDWGGTRRWYRLAPDQNSGELHRDGDRPAVIFPSGERWWYKKGITHRGGDRPAVIQADGTRMWARDGELHRDGGRPAVIDADGDRRWYTLGLDRAINPREHDQTNLMLACGLRRRLGRVDTDWVRSYAE